MVWRADDPQGNESAKVRWDIVPYTRGRVLDLGCGHWKTFPHFIGVDNGNHWGQASANLMVPTCERLDLVASQSCDAVFSSHLLEHIKDYKSALKEWWRVIKMGGHLCLYLPHKDFYPNIGQPGANPDHKHDFLPDDIIDAMKDVGGWDLLENQERNDEDHYSFFQVYKKTQGRNHCFTCNNPKPAKTAAVVRYGAFGDAIQSSSVLPWLKEQGYHITFYTVPGAYDVIKHDPHIDKFIIQDREQVPNHFLMEFWAHEAKKYDRWINLSGSVEGTLLPGPHSDGSRWPISTRRRVMNVNYLEWTHELAEVPFPPRQRFYPTPEERAWARKMRDRIPGKAILWSLAGSSVHKAWPHLDAVVARIMLEIPGAHVVMVGDEAASLLERGWEDETRVWRRSGVWNIRESMAFCEVADVIVGTETGLLNAAGLLDVPKVVTLSHSSAENLTKHWKRTIALTPENVHCYPCHLLHKASELGDAWSRCWKHEETGTSMCQYQIGPATMWDALVRSLRLTEREAA